MTCGGTYGSTLACFWHVFVAWIRKRAFANLMGAHVSVAGFLPCRVFPDPILEAGAPAFISADRMTMTGLFVAGQLANPVGIDGVASSTTLTPIISTRGVCVCACVACIRPGRSHGCVGRSLGLGSNLPAATVKRIQSVCPLKTYHDVSMTSAKLQLDVSTARRVAIYDMTRAIFRLFPGAARSLV